MGKGTTQLWERMDGKKEKRKGGSRLILVVHPQGMWQNVTLLFVNLGSSSRELYPLMVSGIIPRPIALVSSLSASGIPNLAPFRSARSTY